ncbi:MAG: hypothetical protein GXY76_23630 [Chloroflexi bacterium]|nr:hypothetical protein [Chloroflexota bacterium]
MPSQKPMQLALGITPALNNQYLFSDHYLGQLLPNDPHRTAALDEAAAFRHWLIGQYGQEQRSLPRYSESQLEEHWVKPILKQLGHIYEPQPPIPGLDGGIKVPD